MTEKLNLIEDVSLADLTTFRIGGSARFFVKARTENDVVNALSFAETRDLKFFVLGGGSNVLIADEGFDGLVLQIDLKGVEFFDGKKESVAVRAAAGEDWDEFVSLCVGRNLAGVECLSGIPGLVGGTPIQNVGAYGQEVSETIIAVRVLDRNSKEISTLSNAECGFEYRKSIFNTTHRDRFIVLAVDYELKKDGEPKIVYGDLKSTFDGRVPSLSEAREAVCEIRKSKGMLVRQGGLDSHSAGSFFKNPIVGLTKLEEIRSLVSENGIEDVPHFLLDSGSVKIPAAWLIERAGFSRGYQKGNAGLSTKHTLALTNRGGATANEIIDLKREIQSKVSTRFGIELIPEPNFIGFS